MARCPICGKKYADTVMICSTCGARLIRNEDSGAREPIPVQNSTYQQPTPQTPPTQEKPEKKNAGIFWIVVSFLIPIVGIIAFCCWRKKRPAAAKQVLIVSCVSFAIAVISQVGKLNQAEAEPEPTVSYYPEPLLTRPSLPTLPEAADTQPALPSYDTPILPSSDEPQLAEGDLEAFNDLMAKADIVLTPSFSNSACYAAFLRDGVMHDIEYAYEGDVIVESEENLNYNLENFTDEEIQAIEEVLESLVDAAEDVSCAVAYTHYFGNWYGVHIAMWGLDSPENIAEVSEAGLLEVEEGTEAISISLTEEYLLSQGYIKR